MTVPTEVDHLIVGGGPVGLTAALLLAGQGQRCLLVERRDGPGRHPAAHVVNARTLEIFRQAGLDMAAIDALAKDPADAGHVNFVTRLDGQLIGRLPFERQGPDCLRHTPTPLRNISQHRLEPVLAEAAFAAPGLDLRYRTEWQSSSQDATGVTSRIRSLGTGDEVEVRSRYLLATDGAGSRVRKSLGIDMVGPASLQSFIAIHFAADLRTLVADRPGVLHFVMDPPVRGTFVVHDVDRESVFMTSFDPTEETVADYDTARCAQIVRAAIADDAAIDLEILGVDSWHMSAQVANAMRDGRIFLVGDAAHRFPPTGGLGLNTGVADAHNLSWKLVAVDHEWAGRAILDSYEVERQPVAGLNCEQSTANAFKMVSLIEALGLTGAPTTSQMLQALADPDRSEAIASAVADQATHFDMIGLQLGYVYDTGALADRAEPLRPLKDPSRFEARAEVGARLPHGWTGDGRSTLDLVERSGLTLLTVGAHEAWGQGLAEVAAPVTQVGIGRDVTVDAEWVRRCRLDDDGALLVRPDQHIGWRADSLATLPPGALTSAALRISGGPVGRS